MTRDFRSILNAEVDLFLTASGMSGSRLGRNAVGDSVWHYKLRQGRGMTLETVEKVRNYMRNWVLTEGRRRTELLAALERSMQAPDAPLQRAS